MDRSATTGIKLEETSNVESLSSCFFCQKLAKCQAGGDDSVLKSSWLPLVSLRPICRYLKVLVANHRNVEQLKVVLCQKCAEVRNTLSELIQLGEVIEMKISYWLDVLQRVLSTDDSTADGESNGESDSLRKALKIKCSSAVRSNVRRLRPCIPIKRTRPEHAPIISNVHIKTETESFSLSPTSRPGTLLLTPNFSDEESVGSSEQSSVWSPVSSSSSSSSSFISDPPSPFSPPSTSRSDSELIKTEPEAEDGYDSEQSTSNSNQTTKSINTEAELNISRKAGSLQCELCGTAFSYQKTLKKHQKKYHGEDAKPYNPKPLQNSETKRRKRRINSKQYKCTLCEKNHVGFLNFQSHLRQVHQEKKGRGQPLKWKCHWRDCDKLFVEKRSLLQHIQSLHKNIWHECHRCHRKYMERKHLEAHKLLGQCHPTIGSKKLKHVCDVCGKAYRSKSNLSSHKSKMHGKKPRISCDQCGKTFPYKSRLDHHVLVAHSDNKIKIRFPCKVTKCSRVFTNRRSLRLHMAKVHGSASAPKN